jgi:hypothetical protein
MAATKASPSLAKVLTDLEAHLTKKYPRYLASLPAPESLTALEGELGAAVPAPLRELWAWRNGADAFFFAKGEEEGMDWLGVSDAKGELLILRETVPGFSKTLLPFASDGAGNSTCIDVVSAKLFDWDHEVRKATPIKDSLAQALAKVASSAKSGKFQGGPEVVAKPNAQKAKALKLIAEDAVGNRDKVHPIARNAEPKDGVDILRRLHDAITDNPGRQAEVRLWLAVQEAKAGDLDAALISISDPEVLRILSVEQSLWEVAEFALVADQPATALKVYELWKEMPTHGLVGRALAFKKLGQPIADAVKAARKANEAEYGEKSKKNDPAWAAVFEAMLLSVEGRPDDARAHLAAARAKCTTKWEQQIVDAPTDDILPFSRLAKLVGL